MAIAGRDEPRERSAGVQDDRRLSGRRSRVVLTPVAGAKPAEAYPMISSEKLPRLCGARLIGCRCQLRLDLSNLLPDEIDHNTRAWREMPSRWLDQAERNTGSRKVP